MNWYFAIKSLHVVCVIVSIAGFFARYVLTLQKSALMARRWVRIAPHINDTLLLAAAIALTVMSGQYPFVDAWLTAKVFGLIAYIVLASIALKAGRTQRVRVIAGVAALLVFGYIASVAQSKNAWGLLAAGEGLPRAVHVGDPEPLWQRTSVTPAQARDGGQSASPVICA